MSICGHGAKRPPNSALLGIRPKKTLQDEDEKPDNNKSENENKQDVNEKTYIRPMLRHADDVV